LHKTISSMMASLCSCRSQQVFICVFIFILQGITCFQTSTIGICTRGFGKLGARQSLKSKFLLKEKNFDDAELDRAVKSLRDLAPADENTINWDAYRALLAEVAHLSHKDWKRTEENAKKLAEIISGPEVPAFQNIFSRVLEDGGWYGAVEAAAARPEGTKPWAVLVSGLNGIRKTSSIYQPWFQRVLQEAIQPPEGAADDRQALKADELPCGGNSFFRQLDYMIATVANEEFRELYNHHVEDITKYARRKDAIFGRYRCVAEMLGVLLVGAAKKERLNVMLETSGRDVAMFEYVDQFFPDEEYNKLVVHFQINDLEFAKASVDRRMAGEMEAGAAAVLMHELDPSATVRANAGGPYGSAQLAAVQAASDATWDKVRRGEAGGVGASWHKASLRVVGRAEGDKEWTCEAGDFRFPIGRMTVAPAEVEEIYNLLMKELKL